MCVFCTQQIPWWRNREQVPWYASKTGIHDRAKHEPHVSALHSFVCHHPRWSTAKKESGAIRPRRQCRPKDSIALVKDLRKVFCVEVFLALLCWLRSENRNLTIWCLARNVFHERTNYSSIVPKYQNKICLRKSRAWVKQALLSFVPRLYTSYFSLVQPCSQPREPKMTQ